MRQSCFSVCNTIHAYTTTSVYQGRIRHFYMLSIAANTSWLSLIWLHTTIFTALPMGCLTLLVGTDEPFIPLPWFVVAYFVILIDVIFFFLYPMRLLRCFHVNPSIKPAELPTKNCIPYPSPRMDMSKLSWYLLRWNYPRLIARNASISFSYLMLLFFKALCLPDTGLVEISYTSPTLLLSAPVHQSCRVIYENMRHKSINTL